MGAHEVLDPTEIDIKARILELTDGIGPDVVFECIGSDKVTPTAIEVARTGGKIILSGIYEKETSLQINTIVFTDKTVIGSLAYAGDFKTAIDLVSDGRIDISPLVTGRISIDDIIEKGFEELVNRKDENVKIIVKPY